MAAVGLDTACVAQDDFASMRRFGIVGFRAATGPLGLLANSAEANVTL